MAGEVVHNELIGAWRQKVTDFKLLVKLRLTLTVVFSSLMAYLIALGNAPLQWYNLLILAAGGFLVTAASNVLNQVLERDFDKLMTRTADRPIAAGRMDISTAVLMAGFMSLTGITLLSFFNPLAGFFGTVALVSYAFIYTPMKRVSPLAVTVGAIPGALPTLIGCVAAQGELTTLGLMLFMIQFLWQFPHFWSIGWLGFEDYQKAGYQIVPSKDGKRDKSIGFQAFLYALLLMPTTSAIYFLNLASGLSTLIVVLLSLIYTYFAWNFYQQYSRKTALQLMFCSFLYIPLALIVLFIDKV